MFDIAVETQGQSFVTILHCVLSISVPNEGIHESISS
jgi:hypothetical protein